LFGLLEINLQPNWRKIKESDDIRKSVTFYKFWQQTTHMCKNQGPWCCNLIVQCLYFWESTSLSLGNSSGRNSFVLQYRYLWLFPIFCSLLYHSINKCYKIPFSLDILWYDIIIKRIYTYMYIHTYIYIYIIDRYRYRYHIEGVPMKDKKILMSMLQK